MNLKYIILIIFLSFILKAKCQTTYLLNNEVETKVIHLKEDDVEILYITGQGKSAQRESSNVKMENNPSDVVLRFDGKRRGGRNMGTELLLGKEAADKIQELNNYLLSELNKSDEIIVLNWKTYFKNLFYGNFNELRPELNSRGILGNSSNHFPEFHNGFLYYAHLVYGNSYYSGLVYKDFEIITNRTTKDGTGFVVSESTFKTPYRVYLPSVFKKKFEHYLDKDQFSWSGEKFDLEMEYLILDFLEQYGPESYAFKQLMHNLLRYSKGLDPVTKESELVNF